ncbi:MAG: hypothetical protein U9M97_00380 [Candidatus Hadarchaeota archaeon]|nr:hypothetical protein [Candidatus Hadarchaeota archaeon]
MEPRLVLKTLRKFAKRELKEKKARHVYVRQVKMKSLMRRGRLPDLRIRILKGTHYLVCVFYDDSMRVYYIDWRGVSLGANEFEGDEKRKMWNDISRKTKTVFHLSATPSVVDPSATSS